MPRAGFVPSSGGFSFSTVLETPRKVEEPPLVGPRKGPGSQEVTWATWKRSGVYRTLNCFLQKGAGPRDSHSLKQDAEYKTSTKQMKLNISLTGTLILSSPSPKSNRHSEFDVSPSRSLKRNTHTRTHTQNK